jgi:hypothetical protein
MVQIGPQSGSATKGIWSSVDSNHRKMLIIINSNFQTQDKPLMVTAVTTHSHFFTLEPPVTIIFTWLPSP